MFFQFYKFPSQVNRLKMNNNKNNISLSYKQNVKYNVARKLAKRNGAIIYAKAGRIYPTLYLALLFLIV